MLKRGKFGRYAHDKVFIVDKSGPTQVMTGSTNFSVTGLYVNSNHVLIFDTPAVVAAYAGVFEDCWNGDVKKGNFLKSKWSSAVLSSKESPPTEITFSPHNPTVAQTVLDNVVKRCTGGEDGTSVEASVRRDAARRLQPRPHGPQSAP